MEWNAELALDGGDDVDDDRVVGDGGGCDGNQ